MPAAPSPPTTAAPSATAHAIGGSLGSALALLLFYPLERARIELQSRAADATNATQQEQHVGDGSDPESDGKEDVGLSSSSSSSYDMVESSEQQPSSLSTHRQRNEKDGGILSCLLDLHERGELYRGAAPVVTTLGISNYVFFYALNMVKRILAAKGDGNNSNGKAKSLLASSLAGIINVLLTNPLWVANLRIVKGMKTKSSVEKNLFAEIAEEEGVGHLWSGTWASILLVSNPVIQFFTYEQIKMALLRRRQDRQRIRVGSSPLSTAPPSLNTLSPVDAFVIGAVAKTIATVATYPVQLAQTVLRLQEKRSPTGTWTDGKPNHEQTKHDVADGDKDTLRCLVRIYQEGGVAGIYQGMNAKLLQTVLTASFMFIGYEKILEFASLITN